MTALVRIFLTLGLLSLLQSTPVQAAGEPAGIIRYSPALMNSLDKDGQGYLLLFSAEWCPTCKYQLSLLKKLLQEPEFAGARVLEADFDQDEPLKQRLGIWRQGTIIVRRGEQELRREILARDEGSLRQLLRAAQAKDQERVTE